MNFFYNVKRYWLYELSMYFPFREIDRLIVKIIWLFADFPYEIKWFIQRGKRGYSDRDLWSFDLYLAKIINRGAWQLADEIHGSQLDMYDKEAEARGEDPHHKTREILRQIATLFQAFEDEEEAFIWNDDPQELELIEAELHKKQKKALWLLAEHFRLLND